MRKQNIKKDDIIFDSCSICQAEFESLDVLCKLKCSHFYHENCIKKWYVSDNENSDKCPLCVDTIKIVGRYEIEDG